MADPWHGEQARTSDLGWASLSSTPPLQLLALSPDIADVAAATRLALAE